MNTNCTCGQQLPFENCCGRFLDFNQLAKTPEQLMRSRYSAYARGGYGQYLLDTWLPSMTNSMTAAALSERSIEWVELQVLDQSQDGDEGTVEFNAFFVSDSDEREVLHEKSAFQRVAGHWLYVSGETDAGDQT